MNRGSLRAKQPVTAVHEETGERRVYESLTAAADGVKHSVSGVRYAIKRGELLDGWRFEVAHDV